MLGHGGRDSHRVVVASAFPALPLLGLVLGRPLRWRIHPCSRTNLSFALEESLIVTKFTLRQRVAVEWYAQGG